MNKPIFKMLLMKGAKGNDGITEEVPKDGVIFYEGEEETIPDGYEITETPQSGYWIKKVTNALTANAHVVDSLDETTNDHVNAPSINAVREALDVSWDTVYPIGSIYLTTANVDPSTLFGGTWVQIKDRFLLADGDTYHAGATGGVATNSYTPSGTVGNTTLTIEQIPSHNHSLSIPTAKSGGSPNVPTGTAMAIQEYTYTSPTGSAGGGQAHNHSFTGVATTFNNMPPYLVVYVWVRTA